MVRIKKKIMLVEFLLIPLNKHTTSNSTSIKNMAPERGFGPRARILTGCSSTTELFWNKILTGV